MEVEKDAAAMTKLHKDEIDAYKKKNKEVPETEAQIEKRYEHSKSEKSEKAKNNNINCKIWILIRLQRRNYSSFGVPYGGIGYAGKKESWITGVLLVQVQ